MSESLYDRLKQFPANRLRIIIAEAEKQLDAQWECANAHDKRATALLASCAALATISAASFQSAMGGANPLAFGLSALAFLCVLPALALVIAAWESQQLASAGYLPENWSETDRLKTEEEMLADIAASLNKRIVENREPINQRGAYLDWALRFAIVSGVAGLSATGLLILVP